MSGRSGIASRSPTACATSTSSFRRRTSCCPTPRCRRPTSFPATAITTARVSALHSTSPATATPFCAAATASTSAASSTPPSSPPTPRPARPPASSATTSAPATPARHRSRISSAAAWSCPKPYCQLLRPELPESAHHSGRDLACPAHLPQHRGHGQLPAQHRAGPAQLHGHEHRPRLRRAYHLHREGSAAPGAVAAVHLLDAPLHPAAQPRLWLHHRHQQHGRLALPGDGGQSHAQRRTLAAICAPAIPMRTRRTTTRTRPPSATPTMCSTPPT